MAASAAGSPTGDYKVGDQLYFLGPSQTWPDGDKVVHGQRCEVVSMTEDRRKVILRFPGKKHLLSLPLFYVSREPPPALPGGYRVGDHVYYVGPSRTCLDGDKLPHGQRGEVCGPRLHGPKKDDLAILFPGIQGPVGCGLDELSVDPPAALPGAASPLGGAGAAAGAPALAGGAAPAPAGAPVPAAAGAAGGRRIRLMLSGRFDNDVKEDTLRAIKKELDKYHDLEVLAVDVAGGGDFGDKTMDYLDRMDTMVAVAYADYGEETKSAFCTFAEVRYALEYKKNVIPVKLYAGPWPPQPGGRADRQNRMLFLPGVAFIDGVGRAPSDIAAAIRRGAQRLEAS